MAEKRKSCEITYNDNNFKFLLGTMDKKAPKSIYYIIETYITPQHEDDYPKTVKRMDSNIKSFLKNKLKDRPDLFGNDFIYVSELSDTRMAKGKKSYFTLNFFVKPRIEENFKDIAPEYSSVFFNSLDEVKRLIEQEDFTVSKTKK